jgi:hypothetical protein
MLRMKHTKKKIDSKIENKAVDDDGELRQMKTILLNFFSILFSLFYCIKRKKFFFSFEILT